ncbi:MAG: GerAB/ArcD/ProY family transporter [Bacillota bacterium]
MLEKGKISNLQLLLLLINLVTATAILFVPALTTAEAERDGWISLMFLATFFGILVVLVSTALSLRFPGLTLIEFLPRLLGTVPGKALGLFYVFTIVIVGSRIAREFADFMVTAFMPETPKVVFIGVLLLLAASAVRNGLEVIGRMSEFLFTIFVVSFLFIILLLIPDIRLENMFPVLDEGFKPVIRAALPASAFRGELVLLLMFLPYINRPEKGRKVAVLATLIIGLILTMTHIFSITLLGVDLAAIQIFPIFQLARFVNIGGFIERVESLVMVFWVGGVLLKVALFYYASALATAQWLNLKDYKPIVLPLGVIMGAWSMFMVQNSQELIDFIAITWPPYAFTHQLLIPALLLLVAVIRGKGGRKKRSAH